MTPSNDLLTRKEVANRLKVSIRTLDRYIRRGYFDVKRIDRSVWISKPSFERYYQDQEKCKAFESGSTGLGASAQPAESAESVETIQVSEDYPSEEGTQFTGGGTAAKEKVKLSSHEREYQLTPVHIYKKLYEEAKVKYEDQSKRLEGAHYRVGQLEAQVKSMVPMLEFKKERQRLLLMDKQYKENIKEAKVRVVQTKRLFEEERLNKNVYIALVYGLLAAQPVLWLVAKGF